MEKYKKTNYLQSEIKKKALDSNNGTGDGSPEYFLIRSSKGFTLIHFSREGHFARVNCFTYGNITEASIPLPIVRIS